MYLHYPDILGKVSPTTLLYSKTLLMASTKHNYLKYKIRIVIGSKIIKKTLISNLSFLRKCVGFYFGFFLKIKHICARFLLFIVISFWKKDVLDCGISSKTVGATIGQGKAHSSAEQEYTTVYY